MDKPKGDSDSATEPFLRHQTLSKSVTHMK